MLSFTAFLIEKSLYKVDALLRTDPSAGLAAGYASIVPFLGTRASQEVCNVAQELLDSVSNRSATVTGPVTVSLSKLQPTQHAIYSDDVKDIARKQNFDKPIQIFSHNGHLYILNGHHRAAAAAIVGRGSISAYVVQ